MKLVKKKYGTYIEGYKIVEVTKKRMGSFDICIYEREVGYSQYYDFSDFPVDGMDYFSKPAAVFDLFIGGTRNDWSRLGCQNNQSFL